MGLLILLMTIVPASAEITDGLIAEYRFEGDATDSSGNGNHGTPSGDPTYIAGHSGLAVSLDGINDIIALPGDLWTADFSTSFWVRTTAIAPAGTDWFQGLGMVDGEVCGAPVGGDFGIALINGGHVISANVMTTAEVNDGYFHSIILTRSMAEDTVRTYINGQLDMAYHWAWQELTGMPWIGVGNNPCDANFNRRWFPGEIDELRFYDRVLTDEEIAELSETGGVDVALEFGERSIFQSLYPNPAPGRAMLRLALPEAVNAQLEVFDLRGAHVRTLGSGSWSAGSHFLEWAGDDSRGRPVGPGVYFIVFRAGNLEERRKLILLK
jgi:hypothetical protein